MNAREELHAFKNRFDPVLTHYLAERIAETKKMDSFSAQGLAYCQRMILSGGKRLRPALTYWIYRGCGGQNKSAILRAGVSVELMHAFLLVHDDIMDRDTTRHGIPTLHTHYAKKTAPLMTSASEATHAGTSIALVFGDMLAALGNHALFTAPFPSERILCALTYLQKTIAQTVIGQLKDVVLEYRGHATEKDVLGMYACKTAYYTIESPLVLGAILADASTEDLRTALHRFSEPLGIAFQIRDDLLGLFGNAKETGKPVGADIREGKMTLLMIRARTMAKEADRAFLQKALGNNALTRAEVERVRAIVTACGARASVEDTMKLYVTEAQDALNALPIAPSTKKILQSISAYLVARSV